MRHTSAGNALTSDWAEGIISAPPLEWDGSLGPDEEKVIGRLGFLLNAYTVQVMPNEPHALSTNPLNTSHENLIRVGYLPTDLLLLASTSSTGVVVGASRNVTEAHSDCSAHGALCGRASSARGLSAHHFLFSAWTSSPPSISQPGFWGLD